MSDSPPPTSSPQDEEKPNIDIDKQTNPDEKGGAGDGGRNDKARASVKDRLSR